MPRDAEAVVDIIWACRRTLEFVRGMTQAEFGDDLKTQSAVIHQLLIAGEAVSRLSDEFCATHDRIPWRQIRAMRNHLVHAYDHVDLEEVWQTVNRDVPELLEYLERL